MKILRNLFLACMLSPCFCFAQQSEPAPKPVIEYNLGICGTENFTSEHILISEDKTKITFDFFVDSEKVVVKDTDPFIFTVAITPFEDADHKNVFQVAGKDETIKDHDVVLSGYLYSNRFIGLIIVDGRLGSVVYGVAGKLDDLIKNVDVDYGFCVDLHQMNRDEALNVLIKWLFAGDVPKAESKT